MTKHLHFFEVNKSILTLLTICLHDNKNINRKKKKCNHLMTILLFVY